MAQVLGGEVHRCVSCSARFVRVNRFMLSSMRMKSEDVVFYGVWGAIFGGIGICLAIALWTAHRFHRWPF